MNKKDLRKRIESDLSSGKSKEDITRLLLEENADPDYKHLVKELIDTIQEGKKRKVFEIINFIFLGILLLAAAFFIFSKAFMPVIYFILLAYIVFFRKTKQYVWISVLGAAFFLTFTLGNFYGFMEKEPMGLSPLLLVITLIISVVFIVFGFLMPRFLNASVKTP